MRAIAIITLAATMFISNALAATDSPGTAGPLAPAKPAGVKQAQAATGVEVLIVGFLGVAAVLGVLASNEGSITNTKTSSTTATGTNP